MIFIIANCTNMEDKLIGYRLYETESGIVMDASMQSIKRQLSTGVMIENCKLSSAGNIVGTQGTLGRYPTLKCGYLYGKSPVTVIYEYADKSYDVITANGERIRMGFDSLLMIDKSSGLTNSKIEENGRVVGIDHQIEREKPTDIEGISEFIRVQSTMVDSDYTINEFNEFVLRVKDKETLVIPHSVFAIARGGCAYDLVVKEVLFGRQVQNIGIGAFAECRNLKKITFNNGLQNIGSDAFRGTKLLKVELPPSVMKVGKNAFPSVKTIVINNRRTVLDQGAVSLNCRKVYK